MGASRVQEGTAAGAVAALCVIGWSLLRSPPASAPIEVRGPARAAGSSASEADERTPFSPRFPVARLPESATPPDLAPPPFNTTPAAMPAGRSLLTGRVADATGGMI